MDLATNMWQESPFNRNRKTKQKQKQKNKTKKRKRKATHKQTNRIVR